MSFRWLAQDSDLQVFQLNLDAVVLDFWLLQLYFL